MLSLTVYINVLVECDVQPEIGLGVEVRNGYVGTLWALEVQIHIYVGTIGI